MRSAAGRWRRAVRRYGVRGTARRATVLMRAAVVGFRQEHVWYQLPLHGDRPRRELGAGLELVAASSEHLPLLDQLWAVDRRVAEERLRAEGTTLWFVLDGNTPAFSCWTFRWQLPIRAARGGILALPDDTACLEESMTAAAYRGRSIAPAAWTSIADRLAGTGLRRLVTAVEEANRPSRTAVEKIGFVEVGRARSSGRGRRIRIEVSGDLDGDAAFLRALERAA